MWLILNEASRDMAKADILSGHVVYFFDAGITKADGTREQCKVGAIDERAGFKLITAHPDLISECDCIVMHTGIEDSWLVKNQAPIIWIVHGKPLDCFRPEQDGKRSSYSLYSNLAKWNRCKKMIHFWPEYIPFWSPAFPDKKHVCFDYPAIDEQRFTNEGKIHTLENSGKYNILICDSVRADIDLFEMVIGCIEVAKKYPNEFKFHFYGFEHDKLACWQILLNELKRVGGLGDVKPRYTNMEHVYRAVDCVFSPNRINNRVVAEALNCGKPVIQEMGGNGLGDYFCNIPNTSDVVEAFSMFKNDFDNKLIDKDKIIEKSKVFNLKYFSEKMNKIYDEVVGAV
jgi:glycosyltransferase involved in cell wall biosynthesis